jgi:hypothetical protein
VLPLFRDIYLCDFNRLLYIYWSKTFDKMPLPDMTSPITKAKPLPPTLTSLPTELHLLIASHLTYPDALSLKHSNQHFFSLVCTDVDLKIEWLIDRRRLHLDCPHDKGCELGSDMKFCRGSVRYVSMLLTTLLPIH